jgi:acetyltransferase-like isoleucine patch superfamily enzyme
MGSPVLTQEARFVKKLLGVARSFLNPMTWLQPFRLLHYYGYSHVLPRRKLTMGPRATIAPNVSLRNGERIVIGAGTKVGERAYLWAGDSTGRITIGENCRLGPEVFVTASDYGRAPDQNIAQQVRDERDITIGNDVWLGARVFVGTGVTIGDGCVVSANSVVTRDLPAGSIAAGVPARVVRRREDIAPAAAEDAEPQERRAAAAPTAQPAHQGQ